MSGGVVVPPGVVTTTGTGPAAPGGVTKVHEVAVQVAGTVVPLIETVPPVRLVPVIVTVCPPDVGPELGVRELAVGGGMYVKRSSGVFVLVPKLSVTVTSTGPGEPAGEVAVIWVGELTVNDDAAVAPKWTEETLKNPEPVIVTEVPPAVGPAFGVTLKTLGAASTAEPSASQSASVRVMVSVFPRSLITTPPTVMAVEPVVSTCVCAFSVTLRRPGTAIVVLGGIGEGRLCGVPFTSRPRIETPPVDPAALDRHVVVTAWIVRTPARAFTLVTCEVLVELPARVSRPEPCVLTLRAPTVRTPGIGRFIALALQAVPEQGCETLGVAAIGISPNDCRPNAWPERLDTLGIGITGFEAAEAGPVPSAFVAVTANV